MICSNCNNENREGSSFCRFCGSKLSNNLYKVDDKDLSTVSPPFWTRLKTVKNKLSPKIIIISALILLVSASAVFAAPKIKDYLEVNDAIKEAKELQDSGNYAEALISLTQVTDNWSLNSQKDKINELKEKQERYMEYKETFDSALQKEEEGTLGEVREMLKTIDSDFPEYNLVEEKTNEIQSKIEEKLKAEIEEKETERKEAEAQAQVEAKAKRQAQAQAQVEAEAKRQAEAKAQTEAEARRQAEARAQAEAEARRQAEARAQAEAEAKRQAEYEKEQAQWQAQQAEQEKREQAYQAFLDEVVSVWNSLTFGIEQYNNGIDDWNYDNLDEMIIHMGHAGTLFVDTESRGKELYAWSPLTGTDRTAVDNLVCASQNYYNATLEILGWDIEAANYFMNKGWNCYHQVGNFLRSEGR